MDEFTLIKKLESLKTVKPSADWAFSAKSRILSQSFEKEPMFSFDALFSQRKLAPAFASFLIILVTPFFFAQNALPGEALYGIKKAGESIKYAFVTSEEQKSVVQLEKVQFRLNELDKITEQSENQGKKLAAGIKEAKQALDQASKELANVPESQRAELVAGIVGQITAIEEKTNAAIMDTDEKECLYKFFVENEIKYFEQREASLNQEQKDLLIETKKLFEEGKYSEAMEVIYQIQPNN